MKCNLCPRKCNVDRKITDIEKKYTGFCQMPEDIYVARAALHMWEEPCISGENGSGAVFFTGCQLRCVFCQNYAIAAGKSGKKIDNERLSDIFLELQEQKANNINLVTPTHYVPQVAEAIIRAKKNGLHIPVVYNTSAYENVDTLKRMEGLVDIYLPDLKYINSDASKKYSHAPDYFEKASAAIAEMYRQVGSPVFYDMKKRNLNQNDSQNQKMKTKYDSENKIYGIEQGCMLKGMIVRHLMLPGLLNDSKAVIKYLYDTYGDDCYISIMNQYTPLPQVAEIKELNRKITKREYDKVINYAIDIGVENAFIQEGDTAKDSFIPEFDYKGVLSEL